MSAGALPLGLLSRGLRKLLTQLREEGIATESYTPCELNERGYSRIWESSCTLSAARCWMRGNQKTRSLEGPRGKKASVEPHLLTHLSKDPANIHFLGRYRRVNENRPHRTFEASVVVLSHLSHRPQSLAALRAASARRNR